MNVTDFAEQYSRMADEELLCMWADRITLVPEACIALETEVQKRGLDLQSAARVKKRMDVVAAREAEGSLANQIAAAKYERNMRRFVGWREPEFYSPYGSRDIRNTFAYLRHKYRVWKSFREHTGHWPVFSIWFHLLSWIAFWTLSATMFWVESRRWGNNWRFGVIIACMFPLLWVRALGARWMRKVDWKFYGNRFES